MTSKEVEKVEEVKVSRAKKESEVVYTPQTKIVNRMRHDEFVKVDGVDMMIPAQGSVVLINNESVGELPAGVSVLEL